MNLIEVQFTDRSELEPVVERIFERIVGQVIRKGFVLFRCPGGGRGCVRVRRNNWRSGWCTVSPGVIHVWPLDKQINNDNRLSTPLDAEARVTDSTPQGDRMVWEVQSGKQLIQFAHFDPLLSKGFVTGRRLDREVHERIQLETEKRRLEFELEQERLALKDEEIVRGLATRMLEEEKQRSEHMERVLVELQHKLGHRLDTVLEDDALDDRAAEAAEFEQVAEVRENGVDSRPRDINDGDGLDEDELGDVDDPEAWKKDDEFLVISTQSI
ncbi:unnamed protein product [Heligmosomoides polygyrus]|uniref:Uncharacterized protein n=1 Tax=Heligmosomoides polygyrus TaxID=6339 RepID=A0A3P8CZH5_HELPZ|nr:unnamed protein product [Heligmosomoides polygyrus]